MKETRNKMKKMWQKNADQDKEAEGKAGAMAMFYVLKLNKPMFVVPLLECDGAGTARCI